MPNLLVLNCTMEHITKYHIGQLNKKSTFINGLDVDELIHDVLAHPLVKRQHVTKPNRWWYMSKFSKVIGHRGTDGAECRWLAVLVDPYYCLSYSSLQDPQIYALVFIDELFRRYSN